MSTTFIFAYQNPDTDGVCSSIAYAYFKKAKTCGQYETVVFGSVNSETEYVLRRMATPTPPIVSNLPSDARLIVVDTHHPNQLPSGIRLESVVEVLDHHPFGDPSAFPNASIENEPIGAVATLVAEKIRSAGVNIDGQMAGLLAAAIVSNTLNFTAPSTTHRDKAMFAWLQQFHAINPQFIREMFEARSLLTNQTTENILEADYKQFEWNTTKVGISQIEVPNGRSLLLRGDLTDALIELKKGRAVDHAVLNIVDLTERTSILVTPDPGTQHILAKALGLTFTGNVALSSRVLLRKTDLVPQLREFFSRPPS